MQLRHPDILGLKIQNLASNSIKTVVLLSRVRYEKGMTEGLGTVFEIGLPQTDKSDKRQELTGGARAIMALQKI